MARRLSTGMRDYLLAEGPVRKALEDCVVKIYTGSAPASADDAVTGTLLAIITKSGGTVSADERSTPRVYKITIPNATLGNTVKINVTVDGVGPTTHTFTITASEDTDTKVAKKVAQMLSDIPQLLAIADQDATGPAALWVQGRIDGLDLTLADGGGTTTATVTAKQAAVRQDTLQFGPSSGGSMPKNSDVWSGTVLVNGVAGYFRIVTSNDDGTLSTTQLRIQGSCSTSGAELNLSNLSLVATETHTVSNYAVSLPAEA